MPRTGRCALPVVKGSRSSGSSGWGPAGTNRSIPCHHGAFDARILGIRPDLVVQIRRDLLDEIDGPMLEHGLKERHDQPLMILPRACQERPDPELLEIEYQRFVDAS